MKSTEPPPPQPASAVQPDAHPTRPSVQQTFAALKYRNYRLWFSGQLVSLFGTCLPLSSASTMSAVTRASSRVSLNTVAVCSLARMDLTEGTSASWPVITGIGCYGTPLSDEMMPIDSPSYGDSTASTRDCV